MEFHDKGSRSPKWRYNLRESFPTCIPLIALLPFGVPYLGEWFILWLRSFVYSIPQRESVREYSNIKCSCGEYSKRKRGKSYPPRKRKKRRRVCVHKESTVYIELPKLVSKSESEKRGECQILELQLVQPSHGLSCIGATTELTPFLFESSFSKVALIPFNLHVCVSLSITSISWDQLGFVLWSSWFFTCHYISWFSVVPICMPLSKPKLHISRVCWRWTLNIDTTPFSPFAIWLFLG